MEINNQEQELVQAPTPEVVAQLAPTQDFQKLYEQTQEQLRQAEYTAYKLRQEIKTAKESPTVQQPQPQPVLDESRITQIVETALDERTKQSVLDSELAKITDPVERDEVAKAYFNRIKHSDNVLQDIADAKAIAQRDKLIQQNAELTNTALNQPSTPTMTGSYNPSTLQEPKIDVDSQLDPATLAYVTANNWSYEKKLKLLENMKVSSAPQAL